MRRVAIAAILVGFAYLGAHDLAAGNAKLGLASVCLGVANAILLA